MGGEQPLPSFCSPAVADSCEKIVGKPTLPLSGVGGDRTVGPIVSVRSTSAQTSRARSLARCSRQAEEWLNRFKREDIFHPADEVADCLDGLGSGEAARRPAKPPSPKTANRCDSDTLTVSGHTFKV